MRWLQSVALLVIWLIKLMVSGKIWPKKLGVEAKYSQKGQITIENGGSGGDPESVSAGSNWKITLPIRRRHFSKAAFSSMFGSVSVLKFHLTRYFKTKILSPVSNAEITGIFQT